MESNKKDVVISCPFCKVVFCECNEAQLVQHFKEEHSKDVVDDKFKINCQSGYSRNLIFLKDKHILCLTLSVKIRCLKIYILLSPSTSKFKQFTLTFFKSDSGIHFVMPHIEVRRSSDGFPLIKGDSCEKDKANAYYLQLGNCFLFARDLLPTFLQSGSCYCRMDYVDDENANKPNNFEKPTNSKELLCFKDNLAKYIREAGSMDVAALRQFVKKDFRTIQNCSKCKTFITNSKSAFFCPARHLVCENCSEGKCHKCNAVVEWNRQSKWHDTSLVCEWGCNQKINIFDYLWHLHSCHLRRYKCPGRGCSYTGDEVNIKAHWHLNQLKCGEQLTLKWKEQIFYWLLPTLRELIYVMIEMVSDGQFLVIVYEEDAHFPSLYEFDIPNNAGEEWMPLKNQTGRYVKAKSVDQTHLQLNVKTIG